MFSFLFFPSESWSLFLDVWQTINIKVHIIVISHVTILFFNYSVYFIIIHTEYSFGKVLTVFHAIFDFELDNQMIILYVCRLPSESLQAIPRRISTRGFLLRVSVLYPSICSLYHLYISCNLGHVLSARDHRFKVSCFHELDNL